MRCVKAVLGAEELRRAILASLEALRAHQDAIDAANVYPVPDGDTGTNMALTMQAVADALAGAGEDPARVAHAAAEGAVLGARGNSGVILAQIIRGITESLAQGLPVAEGLRRAAALAEEALLDPIEGTMLSVIRAAAEAVPHDVTPAEAFDAAAHAARVALDRTPEQLPILKAAGVVDAGGMGLCVVLDAFAATLAGRAPSTEPIPVVRPAFRPRESGSIEYAYEVVYLLEGRDGDIPKVRTELGSIGDSVAVVGGEGLWKVHVHTNEVDRALEIGKQAGEPRATTVVAFADQIVAMPGARTVPKATTNTPVTVVAVVAGEGMRAIFGELGARVLVDGGRTLNPSVAELTAAIESAPTKDVILLPNNANTLPAAREAAHRTDKRVEIVASADPAQGFAALLAYGDGLDLDRNLREMTEALKNARTGRVAMASRDAATPAGKVRKGQAIGFVGSDPAVIADDPVEALLALLGHLDGKLEAVTVLAGEDVSDAENNKVVETITARYPDATLDLHRTGQPVDRYLVAVE
jgi:fatty acid kinase